MKIIVYFILGILLGTVADKMHKSLFMKIFFTLVIYILGISFGIHLVLK